MKKYLLVFLLVFLAFSTIGCSNSSKTTEDIKKDTVKKEEENTKQLNLEEDRKIANDLKFETIYPNEEVRSYAKKMIGLKAPDFKVNNLKGETIELSKLKGENVLIELGSTTCPACIESYPMVKKFKDKQGDKVKVLTIFPNERKQDVENFFIANQYEKDEDVIAGEGMNSISNDYQLVYTPTFLFVDKEGYIQFVHVGATFDDVVLSSMSDLAFKTNLMENYNQTAEVDEAKTSTPDNQ